MKRKTKWRKKTGREGQEHKEQEKRAKSTKTTRATTAIKTRSAADQKTTTRREWSVASQAAPLLRRRLALSLQTRCSNSQCDRRERRLSFLLSFFFLPSFLPSFLPFFFSPSSRLFILSSCPSSSSVSFFSFHSSLFFSFAAFTGLAPPPAPAARTGSAAPRP